MLNKETILITRSESENKILADKLLESGLNSIAVNIVEYENLNFDINIIFDYEYVVLTSKYACNIIAKKLVSHEISKKILPIFLVVGSESAKIIKQIHYSVTTLSFNNGSEIINFIDVLNKEKIIHLSGELIAHHIKHVTRKIIYKTTHMQKIENPLIEKIKSNQIKYIMVFSAVNFEKLIYLFKTHDILSTIESSIFVCISSDLAKKVQKYFTRFCYTNEPSQKNMIKLITEYERK